MRKIKFRGKDLETGKFIYGDLYQPRGAMLIRVDYAIAARYVDPDSVAQLVGFDTNGCEVYEGDIVIDKFGDARSVRLTATLREDQDIQNKVFIPTERFWNEHRKYSPLFLKEPNHEKKIPAPPHD